MAHKRSNKMAIFANIDLAFKIKLCLKISL